jgi:hypothetical protein
MYERSRAEREIVRKAEGVLDGVRRACSPGARTVVAIVAAAGLALLAAACGGSSGSHVAHLGSTTARPGSSTNSQSATDQPLAFSHCMRSHGVSKFPDPDSSGVWPKSQVELAADNSGFQAATQACGHLLPDGGPGVPPSPAVVQQIQNDMLKFARCMRSHGVPNWPGITLDRGRAIFDPEAVGIDTSSPQISSKMRACEHVFPASLGRPPGT